VATISIRAFGGRSEPGAVSDDLAAVSVLLDEQATAVWVDVEDADEPTLEVLADELGLHHLAVEDALDVHQRDKYVHYDEHAFFVCHDAELDVEAAQLRTKEVAAFIGDRWLVTVHAGCRALVDGAAGRPGLTRKAPDLALGFVLYGLLDAVLDRYFGVLDAFERFYDGAADQVFADVPIPPQDQRRWFEMRKALNAFDRIVRPLGDAVDTMVHQDLDRFPVAAHPYLRDIAGEVSQVRDEATGLRELVRQIVDVNIMQRDYRQNVGMKKVTSWAAIIAVPTLVTGYYGMNVPYPGSGETWGVVVASGVSVATALGLYASFRRRGWL